MKPSGFIVFTGQEPTILDWHIEARKLFKYSDKIIWSKRILTAPYLRLQRTYEEVCIYYKYDGKLPDYFEKWERYEDLKEGALHLGLYELSTISTVISDLQRRLNDPNYNALYYLELPALSGEFETKNNDNQHKKSKKSMTTAIRASRGMKQMDSKNNDDSYIDWYGRAEKNRKNKDSEIFNNNKIVDVEKHIPKNFRYRSKWYCNLTNSWALPPELGTLEAALLQHGTSQQHIQKALADLLSQLPEEYGLDSTIWSYLPENQTKMGDKGINIKHPTVKPKRLIKRIIQLCCPPKTDEYTPLILDPFGGSGTTLVAAVELGLNAYSCDIYDNFCSIANQRVELAKQGHDGAGVNFEQKEANAPKADKPMYVQQKLF